MGSRQSAVGSLQSPVASPQPAFAEAMADRVGSSSVYRFVRSSGVEINKCSGIQGSRAEPVDSRSPQFAVSSFQAN